MNDRIPVREARRQLPGGLRWGLAGLVALAAVAGSGACTKSLEVPAINPTPTGQVVPGKVVWHDLVTTDVNEAKRFYGELFGWTFQTIASDGYDYVIAMIGPRPIAGIMRPEKRLTGASEWVHYISVANVDATAALIEPAGGVLSLKPEDLPHRGRIALAEDPEGAPFGIIRSESGDRPDGVDPPHNDFLWDELWTNDLGLAALFYRDAIGLDSEVLARKTGDYLLFASGGERRAGGILIPQADIEPQWLPTVRVIDIKASVERARQLGGEIALEPRWDIEDGMVAIISDPGGAGVTLRQWEGDR
jgi:hypothetical protein